MELRHDITFVFAKEACYVCGRGAPLVDLGVAIEGEGALAICPGCSMEAARAAGFQVRKPAARAVTQPMV